MNRGSALPPHLYEDIDAPALSSNGDLGESALQNWDEPAEKPYWATWGF